MYCTIADIQTRIPIQTLIDITGSSRKDTNEPDTVIIEAAISDASALIDNKIGSRFVLPLDPIPSVFIRIIVDIVIYYLFKNRYMNDFPTEIKSSYTEAIAFLDSIADGSKNVDGIIKEGFEFKVLTNIRHRDRMYGRRTLRRML